MPIAKRIGQFTCRWGRFLFAFTIYAILVAVAFILAGSAMRDIIFANAFAPAADLIIGITGNARFGAIATAANLRRTAFGLTVTAMLCIVLQIDAFRAAQNIIVVAYTAPRLA